MFIIGLTGTIASGKSTVMSILSKMPDVSIISMDDIARLAVAPNTKELTAIADMWGDKCIKADGSLDRKYLGSIVFNDQNAKHQLESILNPKISELYELALAKIITKYVIVENAVMFESLQYQNMDAFILLDVDVNLQIDRLMARNSLTYDEAQARIAAQMSTVQKLDKIKITNKPYFVIENNSDLVELEFKTLLFWKLFTKKL